MINRGLIAPNASFDLDDWIGQRQATFRFDLINGVTGENIGTIHPLRGATLRHDVGSSIKRNLTMDLGVASTAEINKSTDRIEPFMVFPDGTEYPLGRYLFADVVTGTFTSGDMSNVALTDEMFIVDQAIEAGINGVGVGVTQLILRVLSGFGFDIELDPCPFTSAQAWAIGSYRGNILEDLAVTGGYFSPWFDNNGTFRMIQAFEPATRVPDRTGRSHDSSGQFISSSGNDTASSVSQTPIQVFNYDEGNQVIRSTIARSDQLLTAPNRFIVISNNADDATSPVVGLADVPVNAPNSIPNRGFIVTSVNDLQISTSAQATVAARNLAVRQNIIETVSLSTPPDPRHDAYDVIQWQEELWLELAWSMNMMEGGNMTHLMRKSYS